MGKAIISAKNSAKIFKKIVIGSLTFKRLATDAPWRDMAIPKSPLGNPFTHLDY